MKTHNGIVIASHEDPEYDQVSIQRFLLNTAYTFRLRNLRTFWLLLGSYSLLDPGINARALDEKYPGELPLVFKTQGTNTSACEYHDMHGGLYRMNVQDVLQGWEHQLGKTCNPIHDVMTCRKPFLNAVTLVDPRECLDDRAHERQLADVTEMRETCMEKAGLIAIRHITAGGVRNAHESAFQKYRSDLIVIDNDFLPWDSALLARELAFDPGINGSKYVHLWYSRNPVNYLEYGHGGVKVFPREAQTLRRETDLRGDFTMSVGDGLVIHPVVLGFHSFNWSAFSSWSTAAKECAKLSRVADQDPEAGARLRAWLTIADSKEAFYKECLAGAAFGSLHSEAVFACSSRTDLIRLFNESLQGATNG